MFWGIPDFLADPTSSAPQFLRLLFLGCSLYDAGWIDLLDAPRILGQGAVKQPRSCGTGTGRLRNSIDNCMLYVGCATVEIAWVKGIPPQAENVVGIQGEKVGGLPPSSTRTCAQNFGPNCPSSNYAFGTGLVLCPQQNLKASRL